MSDIRDIETRRKAGAPPRAADRELLAYLHGELDEGEKQALLRRLEREPVLARRLRSLEATWNALDLPPVAPPPLGFASRVAARAADEGRSFDAAGAFRPAWVRVAGAAVLAAGIAAGAGLGLLVTPERVETGEATPFTTAGTVTTTSTVDSLSSTTGTTLAEAYWSVFEDDQGALEEVR